MNSTSILVFFFIVLIIYITLSPYSVSYHRRCIIERFAEPPMELTSVNMLANRKLYFEPPHSVAIASQRSIAGRQFDTVTNCSISSPPQNVKPQAQSLISEMGIYYKLSSSCFSFKAEEFKNSTITLKIDSPQDWFKYVYLILLNPVFVEINKDNDTTTSYAYYPYNRTLLPITNFGNGDWSMDSTQTAYDDTILNLIQLQTGSLFNYNNLKTYAQLEKLNINQDPINVKVYYAKPHETAQSVGTSIKYNTPSGNGTYLVSSTTYDVLREKKNDSDRPLITISEFIDKYFNSNTRMFYPTFTISFKLLIGDSNGQTNFSQNTNNYNASLEMYMNNTFGINSSCNSNINYPPHFSRNGNIFTIVSQRPMDDNNTILIKMGTSVGGCLFQGNFIELTLPFFNNYSTEATCIVTFSPYTIDFLAHWVNPTKEKNDNFEFIYQQMSNNKSNDFSTLFLGDLTKNSQLKYGDIYINVNNAVIPFVNEVQLGHKNMAEYLYDVTH